MLRTRTLKLVHSASLSLRTAHGCLQGFAVAPHRSRLPSVADESARLVSKLRTVHANAPVAELLIAFAQRRREAAIVVGAHVFAGGGRVVAPDVVLGGEPLQRSRALQLEREIDDPFV